MVLFFIVILFFLFFVLLNRLKFILFKSRMSSNDGKLYVVFGVPGSGKTTLAAAISSWWLKKGKTVFSNVDIKGTLKYNVSEYGMYNMSDCLVVCDEAGFELNNRNFSTNFKKWGYVLNPDGSFKKVNPDKDNKCFIVDPLRILKLHRHFCQNMIYFSQSYDDMDIKVRQITDAMYLVTRSIIPGFIVVRRIRKVIGINKDTSQVEDQYSFSFFSKVYIRCKPYWSYFDTLDRPYLPECPSWEVWGEAAP